MKKNKLFLIALSCTALFACSSNTSSVSPSSTIVTPSSTVISSTQDSSVISSSSVKDDGAITPEEFKVTLDKATESLKTKNAVSLSSTDGSLSINGSMTKKEAVESKSGTDTTSKSNSIDFKMNNTTVEGTFKNLQGTKKEDLEGSGSFSSDLTFDYTDFGEKEKTIDIDNKKVGADIFLENNVGYAQLSHDTVNLIMDIIDGIGIDSIDSSDIPQYVLINDILSDFDIEMPINILDDDSVKDFLNSFVDDYKSLPSAFRQALTFNKEDDYVYLDITLTKMLLSSLPLAYQTYAIDQLDSTSETYEQDVQDIKDDVSKLNKLFTKTTLREFNIQVALNDTGLTFAKVDIDLTIKDYQAYEEIEEDVDTDEKTTETITVDSLAITASSLVNFTYDDAVTVKKHGDYNFKDYSDEFHDFINTIFGKDEGEEK